MRIVVNDIAASKTGALSILMDFYHYVREHDTQNEWIFLVGAPFIEETERIRVLVMEEVKRSQKNRLKFDLLTGSKFIENLHPDVVFSMQNTLTRGKIRKADGSRVRQVLYVHQPLGFQKTKRFSFVKKEEREYAVYQYLIGSLIDASVKRASQVIVQTQWMKEAVQQKTRIAVDKIVNILPNVENLSAYRKECVFDRKSFFFPSGEILYKNHECVLKAAAILNKRGMTDFHIQFTLKGLSDVTERIYEDPHHNVEWGGRIPREKVLERYNTDTLIFPSYIETYGVPLAEARQMNTIILASDLPFCHEVLEGYENAYYFNPFQEQELADLMEQVMQGKIVRKEITAAEKPESIESNSYGKIVDLITEQTL